MTTNIQNDNHEKYINIFNVNLKELLIKLFKIKKNILTNTTTSDETDDNDKIALNDENIDINTIINDDDNNNDNDDNNEQIKNDEEMIKQNTSAEQNEKNFYKKTKMIDNM